MLDILLDPNSPFMWLLIIALITGALAILFRPFLTFAKFAYPNAKFESIGNPFVKSSHIQRLLDYTDLQQFIDQLNNQKDYTISETSNAAAIQQELDHQFVHTIQMMKHDSAKKMHPFYNMYLETLDANLVKTAFKQYLTDKKIDEKLSEQAVSPTIQQHLLLLSKTEPENIQTVLQKLGFSEQIQHLFTAEEKEFSSFALDAAVDAFFIKKLQAVSVPYKCEKAKYEFIKRMIDIRTIKHILRAKHLGYDADHCSQLIIDEGFELAVWKQKELCKAENPTEVINKLEGTKYYHQLQHHLDTQQKNTSVQSYTDAIDRVWLTLVKNISTSFYTTIGPSLRFLEYKQTEIRNLKIMAKGIAEKLPKQLISSLLIMEETT